MESLGEEESLDEEEFQGEIRPETVSVASSVQACTILTMTQCPILTADISGVGFYHSCSLSLMSSAGLIEIL